MPILSTVKQAYINRAELSAILGEPVHHIVEVSRAMVPGDSEAMGLAVTYEVGAIRRITVSEAPPAIAETSQSERGREDKTS